MLTSMTEQDFDQVIAVHLKGSFNLTHHASLHWRALGKAGKPVAGRIVNTTSGAGLWGNLGQLNYATAKAGLVAMTTVTAMEMGRYGVTANIVSPIARTRMTADLTWVDGDTIMRVNGFEMDPDVRYRTGVGHKLDATKLDTGMRKAYGLVPGGIPSGS
jgi:NAD(P)-dependent dehydrogenase (short-subunit alcohol dehydrogenase family)